MTAVYGRIIMDSITMGDMKLFKDLPAQILFKGGNCNFASLACLYKCHKLIQ